MIFLGWKRTQEGLSAPITPIDSPAARLAYLRMDLVHAANADGEQELLLRLDIEASLGLSLALQADGLLLL